MKSDNILRDILPDILIDNFDIVKHEKTDSRFDIWLNEKKVQLEDDEVNPAFISHGFTDYRIIQDLVRFKLHWSKGEARDVYSLPLFPSAVPNLYGLRK